MNWKRIRNNIPSHIQVSKKDTYEIVWVNDFKDEKVLGETRYDSNQIAIKLGLSDKETVLTLYHELYHAISGSYGINLTETQVILLEKSLHYFLKFVTITLKGKNNGKRTRRKFK